MFGDLNVYHGFRVTPFSGDSLFLTWSSQEEGQDEDELSWEAKRSFACHYFCPFEISRQPGNSKRFLGHGERG